LLINRWDAIRDFIRSECAVQDLLFNYNLIGTLFADIRERVLNDIVDRETTLFKLNYSLGYILRHKLTGGELRYYHPCQNIGRKLQVPILIKNRDDLKEFLDSLSDLSFRNQTKYENSEWALVCVTNIVFFINKLRDHPIGCGKVIPDYVKNNKGLYALVTNKKTGVAYEDNLCPVNPLLTQVLFRALHYLNWALLKICLRLIS